MGFIGTNPPAARVIPDGADEQTRVAAQVDGTAKVQVGHVAWFKDSAGRISVLRYVQAQASIVKGATLMTQAGGATTLNSSGVSTLAGRDPGFVTTATTGIAGQNMCAGFAAADVSNTGYYLWAYVNGYCPDAALPTNYASGMPMRLSATYAGRLSSAAINVSTSHTATWTQHIVAISLGAAAVSTANSTNSVIIKGWLA